VRLQGDGGQAVLRRDPQQAVTASHQTRSRYAASLTLVAALALLTGCSVFKKKEVRTCPRVEIVEGLNRLIKFGDGPGRDPSDILYAARINDARSECHYDESGVNVDMTVSIVGERGRGGAKLPGGDVTYFVAITDAQRNIVAKQTFTSRLAFSSKGMAQLDDELEQRIPLKKIGAPLDPVPSAQDHTIILGFQLTAEEIDYNEKQNKN
jgi:hypothetical protein